MYTISQNINKYIHYLQQNRTALLSDECLGPIIRSARLRNTFKKTVKARSSRSLTCTVRCVQLPP